MKRSEAKVLSERSVDERGIYEELRLGVCWGLEVGDRKRRVKRRRESWRRAGCGGRRDEEERGEGFERAQR